MADLKTHLRELGVATFVGILRENLPISVKDIQDGNTFFQLSKSMIKNDISKAVNLTLITAFNSEEMQILQNAYRLASYIVNCGYFSISQDDVILWLGYDSQKGDPIDVQIGKYGFSLKEDSYILKNMGLYELINSLTGTNHSKGLHAFKDYASGEYNAWFEYTWNSLQLFIKTHKKWEIPTASILRSGNYLVFLHNNHQVSVPCSIKSIEEFEQFSNSEIREKVFAKWIGKQLSEDTNYLALKKNCAVTAGQKICKKINLNFNPYYVSLFLQLLNKEYYYAKTTSEICCVFRVPSVNDFSKVISFEGCEYSVPKSQLNIITKFKNVGTGKCFEFRNECRFSHGQFNGCPEAKLYIGRNSSLCDLYDPI